MKKSTLYSIELAARRDEAEWVDDLRKTFHQVTPATEWEKEMVVQDYRVGWILPEAAYLEAPADPSWWTILTYSDTPVGLRISTHLYQSESEAVRWQKIIHTQAAHLRETGVETGAFSVRLKFPANYIETLAVQFENQLAERTLAEEQERGSDSTLGMGTFDNSALQFITGYFDDEGISTGKSTWPEGMGLVFTPAEWRSHERLRRAETARAEHLPERERSRGRAAE